MNTGAVTDAIGRIWAASGQRWALIVLAVLAIVGASMSTGRVAGHVRVEMVVLVAVLAVLAVVVPDSHAATAAIAVVAIQWFLEADDVASAWSLVAATGLVVFHLAVALMAVTPVHAVVCAAVLTRWARRGAVVLVATVVVWGGVASLDGRSVPGGVALVLAALVALTVVVVAASVRSTADPGPR